MTLALLRNKHMPALNLFFFSLKKNLPLMILALAFMALINPGLILSYIGDSLEHMEKYDPVELYDLIHVTGLGTTIATALLSMLFCLINFSYLYKKPAGDVFHALPVSRTKLLLSRYFASVVPSLAPALLSYVSLTFICMIDRVEGDIAAIWTHAALNVGIVLVMSAMTMIFLVCAGNMFSFFASLCGLNVGIPIILYIGIELCDNYLLGFVSNYEILYYCTPAFFAFSRYMYFEDSLAAVWLQLPWLVLIAAVCLTAAVLLYNRRKSEKSGETYAFRFVYYIVSVLLAFIGAFVVGYIFSDGDFDLYFWVFGLFGGILTAIAFGAITDKGFKTVKRSAILGGCAYIIMLMFTFGIILDVTGFEKQVPRADEVKKVTIDHNHSSVGDIVLTDPADVIALHEAIIDPLYSDYQYAGHITIEYELKNGGTLAREYSLDTQKVAEAYHKLWMNKEWQQEHLDAFMELDDHSLGAQYTLDYYYREESYSLKLSKEETRQILTHYFADIEKTDAAVFNYEKDRPSVYLHGQAVIFDSEFQITQYKYVDINLQADAEMPNTQAYLNALLMANTASSEAK